MNRAFTLVEMLLALALTAVLSVAILTVNVAIARSDQAMANADTRDHGVQAMLEVVRRDLVQASTLDPRTDTLALRGPVGLDRRSLATAHRRATVDYVIDRTGKEPCLLRVQADLDELTNRNTWSQLVAVGIERIEWQLIDVERSPPGTQSGCSLDVQDVDLVPACLLLTIHRANSRGGPLQTVIWTR